MANSKKQIRNYDKQLQSHIDKRDFVTINRTFKGREENIAGFILARSKNFLLLHVGNEFRLEGYAIIRKDQVDNVRCNKYDKTQKKIYKAEGLLANRDGINKKISLESWQSIFNDLKALGYHVIIEREDMGEDFFDIGPIKKVLKDSVSIQYYSPTGQLENKLTSIKYAEITIVKFEDNYSTTFRKYLIPAKR